MYENKILILRFRIFKYTFPGVKLGSGRTTLMELYWSN